MIENEMLASLVRPELQRLEELFAIRRTTAAEAMLLAIGLQESGFVHRDQVVPGKPYGQVGPATGFWQFELRGGTTGVLNHPATGAKARQLCDQYQLSSLPTAAWQFFAEEAGDELACDFARLLLLTDMVPLPMAVESTWEVAFNYYLRNWRPGAWFGSEPGSQRRVALAEKFRLNWLRAVAAVGGSAALQPPTEATKVGWKQSVLAEIETLKSRIAAMED